VIGKEKVKMNRNIIRPVLLVFSLLLFMAVISFADQAKKPTAKTETNIIMQEKSPPVPADPAAGEEINWQVISSGGDIGGSSANFKLSGTVGQTAVGAGGSDNFGLSHGFWQEIAEVCDCMPGDANNDGEVNVGDAVYLISYVFKGGPPPVPYAICSGDANCDCQCNVGDAVFIISYVFKGGPAPCDCETWRNSCGPGLYKKL
jgi:hypothetical protein